VPVNAGHSAHLDISNFGDGELSSFKWLVFQLQRQARLCGSRRRSESTPSRLEPGRMTLLIREEQSCAR